MSGWTAQWDDVRNARRSGEEYLLERSLLRRRSTGDVPVQEWRQLSFPTRWHYDVLRAMEYFRAADVPEAQLEEAIELDPLEAAG